MKKNRECPSESSKFQAPGSNEIRNSKLQKNRGIARPGAWILELLWCLDVGAWRFVLMRMGTVIGRVTLSKTVPSLIGGRWLVVSPFTREHFQRGTETPPGMSKDPSLVVYDDLGGGVGQTIGFTEGREAAQPFDQPTPIDAINAALVDEIFYSPL
jgi:ethanolamine utilization protein EutN